MMFVLCLEWVGLCFGQGIRFESGLHWNDIKMKARAESKYILIDAFATWCEPCTLMADKVFSQTNVGEAINKHFISVKVQMDKTKNDNEFIKSWYEDAHSLAAEGKLNAYPTLLFYSEEGELVHKTVGYKDASALIKEAKNALDPNKQYFTLLEKYKHGKLPDSLCKSFSLQAADVGDNKTAGDAAHQYLHGLTRNDFYKKENLIFLSQFLSGSSDKYFDIFLNNHTEVNKAAGKNFAENVVMSIATKEEVTPYDQKKNPDWDAIERRMKAKYGVLGEERVWGHRTVYYSSIKDWKNFSKYYKKYFDRAIPNERSFLHINNMSWPVVEHVSDKGVVETAVRAMKYDIDKFNRDSPEAIDTYANLLYKSGRKKEAIEWEEKAMRLSDDKSVYQETLSKMMRGEKTW